jgi:hypothetical protein
MAKGCCTESRAQRSEAKYIELRSRRAAPPLLAEDSHDVAGCDAEDAPSFGFQSDIHRTLMSAYVG